MQLFVNAVASPSPKVLSRHAAKVPSPLRFELGPLDGAKPAKTAPIPQVFTRTAMAGWAMEDRLDLAQATQVLGQQSLERALQLSCSLAPGQAAKFLLDPVAGATLHRLAALQGQVVQLAAKSTGWALVACQNDAKPHEVRAQLAATDRTDLLGRFHLILPTPPASEAAAFVPQRFLTLRAPVGPATRVLRKWEEKEGKAAFRMALRLSFHPAQTARAAQLRAHLLAVQAVGRFTEAAKSPRKKPLCRPAPVAFFADTPANRAYFLALDTATAKAAFDRLDLHQDARLAALPIRPTPSFLGALQ